MSSDSETEEPTVVQYKVVQGYNHEPRQTDQGISHCWEDTESDSDEEIDEEGPLYKPAGAVQENDPPPDNIDWCLCGQCVPMRTSLQCVCCHFYTKVVCKLNFKGKILKCITEHPGFQSNCLDIYVLETSYYEFIQEDGPPGDDELQDIHRLYRYLAYRRFVRWIFRRLGRKVRKVLPACVRDKIKNSFPSEAYTDFKYAR